MNKYKKHLSCMLSVALMIWNFSFFSANASNDSTPTLNEKTKVEQEVIKLQWNLFDTSKNYLEKLTSDFKKLSNYQENWNSKIEFNFDDEFFGNLMADLSINDYSVKNSSIDSSSNWNFKLKTKYNPTYGSWFELDLSTFASLISKDGEIYALLKDFDYKVNDENAWLILEKLKETFKDNKYIKFPNDENTTQMVNLIKSFDLNSSVSNLEKLSKSPLFTTYKKSWDKYLLVPTKNFCDNYFEIKNKISSFNKWYNPTDCSELVYKTFVKEFLKTWELYLILWDENTLWFYSKKDNDIFDFSMNYNDKNITKIDLNIIPDQKIYKNEWLNFKYKLNDYLKLNFFMKKWKEFIRFESILDQNNKFKEFNSELKIDTFSWKIGLKDNKINWFYIIKENSYNWETDKDVLKNVFWIKITWNTKNDNSLNDLTILIAWVNIKDKKVLLKWKMNYNWWNFSFNYNLNDEYSEFKINWNWSIDKNYLKLNSTYQNSYKSYDYTKDEDVNSVYSWNFNITIDQKDDKNNIDFYFNMINLEKNILKLSIKNDAKRVYKDDIKIEAPTDYKDLEIDSLIEDISY